KKHGITTPYTSYLVVPDGPTAVAQAPQFQGNALGRSLPAQPAAPPVYLKSHGYQIHNIPNVNAVATAGPMGGSGRIQFGPVRVSPQMPWAAPMPAPPPAPAMVAQNFQGYTQTGQVGVDQSIQLYEMRTQSQVTAATVRKAAGRDCR